MIDIHSHLFNLKYLPVSGIIRSYTNNKVSQVIADGVERFFLKRTSSDIEIPQNPLQIKKGITISEVMPEFKSKINSLSSPFKLKDEEIVSHLASQLTKDDFSDPVIIKALKEFQKTKNKNIPKEIVKNSSLPLSSALKTINLSQTISEKHIEEYNVVVDVIMEMIKSVFAQMIKLGKSVENNLKWFFFMTNSEHVIWNQLQQDENGIGAYVNLMMDVEGFFGKSKPTFDFETVQIPKMQKISEEFPQIISFVAFNPIRENYLDIIKNAVEKRGFKGVKFYPPMGYRAASNANAEFQTKVDGLFAYCETNDIPILTHCNNEGFQSDPDKDHPSGYNSNPVFWEQALIKFPGLRLCMAHAGGTEGWFSDVKTDDEYNMNKIDSSTVKDADQIDWNSSYAKLVYKLCVKYVNVYCDVAFLDEVFTPETLANYKQRLLLLFKGDNLDQTYSFKTKVMYGSDWHMLFRDGCQDTYLSKYIEIFDGEDLKDYKTIFFETNGKKYLGL